MQLSLPLLLVMIFCLRFGGGVQPQVCAWMGTKSVCPIGGCDGRAGRAANCTCLPAASFARPGAAADATSAATATSGTVTQCILFARAVV